MSNLEMDVIICTTILIARKMVSLFIIIVKILSVCARARARLCWLTISSPWSKTHYKYTNIWIRSINQIERFSIIHYTICVTLIVVSGAWVFVF